MKHEELHPWQRKIEQLLDTEPHKRDIYWIWESEGNVGKSAFVKYMSVEYGTIIRGTSGKQADLINLAYNVNWETEVNALIIDLPRCYEGRMAYGAVEDIKNGYITNFKYECGSKKFNEPHIIIFSNYPPGDLGQFSIDRWKIHKIVDNDIDLTTQQLY